MLTHELSHLHMAQHRGSTWRHALPSWFSEGLAVLVSGGGGDEHVSPAEARAAIAAGVRLAPRAASSFTGGDHAKGLSSPMFYRQSGMFVGWLRDRDLEAFRMLLLALERRATFPRALSVAYHADVGALWQAFVDAP